jgi:hypothetical protein
MSYKPIITKASTPSPKPKKERKKNLKENDDPQFPLSV